MPNNRRTPLRRECEAAIVMRMLLDPAQLPGDIALLKAMLIEENRRATEAEARASDLDAEIENLKLQIAKLRHARFGNSSERTSVLMDQLELQLGELVERRAQETRLRRLRLKHRERRRQENGAIRCAVRCRIIFPASAWCCRRGRPAPAVAGGCASWERT